MAKDIQMVKGQDKITINENNLEFYKSLGYKEVGQQREVAKPKTIEKEKDNKEKKWR
tara:strand:- start:125 stop:295 length:171 start_codon:yes stop_codon:yes gene_type:complete